MMQATSTLPIPYTNGCRAFELPYEPVPNPTPNPEHLGNDTCQPDPNGGLLHGIVGATTIRGPILGLFTYEDSITGATQLGIKDMQRFLIWNNYGQLPPGNISAVSTQASVYLGQADSHSRKRNKILGTGTYPAVDGDGKLWTQSDEGRFVVYDLPIITNGQEPLLPDCLGCAVDPMDPIEKFQRNVYRADDPSNLFLHAATAMEFGGPPGAIGIWVADDARSRVFRIGNWDTVGAIPSEQEKLEADMVLGQVILPGGTISIGCNRLEPGRSANRLCRPSYLAFDRFDNLFVVDNVFECGGNGRVLMFAAEDLETAAGQMAPDTNAAKIFAKDNFSDTTGCPVHAVFDAPTGPVSVIFDSSNRMILTNDGESNPQDERVLKQIHVYKDPLARWPVGQKQCVVVTAKSCFLDEDCPGGVTCEGEVQGICSTIGGNCFRNEDCGGSYFCNGEMPGECAGTVCASDGDCLGGEICVNVPSVGLRCTIDDRACSSAVDCAAAEACAVVPGECTDGTTHCLADSDCPTGKRCRGRFVQGQKPDGFVRLPMGAGGDLAIDSQDNLFVQDHTWNRTWMLNLTTDPQWLASWERDGDLDSIDNLVDPCPFVATDHVACSSAGAKTCECNGDCDGNAVVTQDEIDVAVNILLENETSDSCPSADHGADSGGFLDADDLDYVLWNRDHPCPRTDEHECVGSVIGSGTIEVGYRNGKAGDTVSIPVSHDVDLDPDKKIVKIELIFDSNALSVPNPSDACVPYIANYTVRTAVHGNRLLVVAYPNNSFAKIFGSGTFLWCDFQISLLAQPEEYPITIGEVQMSNGEAGMHVITDKIDGLIYVVPGGGCG